jgi:hypothetical protein
MIISSLFGIVLASVATPAAATPAGSHLVVQLCDFGEAYQFSETSCSIELQNIGDTPIHLKNLRGTRPGDSLAAQDLTVPAHGISLLKASLSLRNEEGVSRFIFSFDTDEPGQEHRSAEVRGFVDSVLDENSPSVDFGVPDAEKLPLGQDITLSSRAVADFRITDILEKPKYVDVSIGKDHRTISVLLKPGAPLGPNLKEVIKVAVNTPEQSQVWIKLKSNVNGDVVPSGNPFALGLMRTGNDNEFRIRLNSRSGKEYEVSKIEVERIAATADIQPCLPKSPDCKMLRLKVSSEQPTGQVGGVVRLRLAESDQELPIYVWGMLLKPETKVIDYNKEMEKAQDSKQLGTSTEPPKLDIKDALKLAVKEAEDPTPPGRGPLIKWAATNEQLVYGYAIYRSNAQAGPFVRLNAEAIHAKNNEGSGSSYQWRDTSAVKGSVYWYYIGLLNRDGSKQQLSTPQEVTAK